VLITVAMATDKHATMGNHATVEAFSLWSVPVMTSFFVVCSRARNVTLTVPVTSQYSGRAAFFREELQSCRRTDPAILEDRR
jgi:hypothetical protein